MAFSPIARQLENLTIMEADSSMDHDGGPNKKRKGTSSTRGTQGTGGFGNKQVGVKDGYGKRIKEMEIFNPWNKGGQKVYHTVKTIKYLDFNFDVNQNPFIIPYQTVGYWFSMWDQTGITENRSIINYRGLANIARGMAFIEGRIKWEVYTVTRQRLLQQGATNTLTWDFETSQNLFFAKADRQAESYLLNSAANTGPLSQHTQNTRLFNPNNDTYTKEEIPQRLEKEITIRMPQLEHNYMYRAQQMNPTEFRTLIPGAQGIPSTVTQTTTLQRELVNQDKTLAVNGQTQVNNTFMQPRVSYPRYHLGQPEIPDETGMMKFRYQVRQTTELDVIFYLYPDFNDQNTNAYSERQVIDLPAVATNASTSTSVFCLPYEIQT